MRIKLKLHKYTNEILLLGLLLNSTLISILIREIINIFFTGLDINGSFIELFIIVIPLIKYLLKIMKIGMTKVHFWLISIPLLFFCHAGFIARIPHMLLIDGLIKFYSRVILIAFLFYEIEDMKEFENSLKPYIVLSILITVIRIFVTPSASNFYFTYTYAIIIPTLLCVVLAYNGQKKYMLCFFFLTVGIFVYGARGGLLCIGVTWILLSILNFTNRSGFIKNLILVSAVIVVIITKDALIPMLARYFEGSRFLDFILGNIVDNTRSRIWELEIEAFLDNPFAIRGLFSDRMFLGNVNKGLTRLIGSYSHNFIFELIYEFGAFGIIIISCFIFLIMRMFLRAKRKMNIEEINIMILVMAFFIGKLSISSSYLIDRASGCILGILLVSNGICRHNFDYKMSNGKFYKINAH